MRQRLPGWHSQADECMNIHLDLLSAVWCCGLRGSPGCSQCHCVFRIYSATRSIKICVIAQRQALSDRHILRGLSTLKLCQMLTMKQHFIQKNVLCNNRDGSCMTHTQTLCPRRQFVYFVTAEWGNISYQQMLHWSEHTVKIHNSFIWFCAVNKMNQSLSDLTCDPMNTDFISWSCYLK